MEVVRDVVPLGPRAGRAPLSLAGPSDFGIEKRAGPAGATPSFLGGNGGDLGLSVGLDIFVGGICTRGDSSGKVVDGKGGESTGKPGMLLCELVVMEVVSVAVVGNWIAVRNC